MSFEIRIVQSAQEKQQAYQMRYQIYCKELNFKLLENDSRILTDHFDDTAYIFVAYKGDKIAGTMRVNLAKNSELPFEAENMVRQIAQNFYPGQVSSATKFAVNPEYRSSMLAFKMVAASYRFGLSQNMLYDFIDINNPNLIGFYQKLGYQKYSARKFVNQYGQFQPMVLEVFNEKYLTKIKSPLAKILKRHLAASHMNSDIYERVYHDNPLNDDEPFKNAV